MGGSSKTTEAKQTATTQPQTPTAIRDPILNYYGGIDNYLGADPNQFVTPINDIQKAAFNNAGGLFGAGDIYGQAAKIAANAAGNPLTAAKSQGANAEFYKGEGAGSSGSQGYQASSMMDGFNRYLDPTLGALVDTTLADFDVNSERQKAAQMSRFAKAGAFGGSRSAIGEGLLDAELARARASTDAGLRSDAWRQAGQFAQFDATGRNQASQFGANAANQAALANAANATSANIAQMQAANQLAMENARLTQDQGQFEAAQANALALQQKQLELQASGLLANIGSAGADTYRADLGAQMNAGNNLYSLENAAIQAPITQLETVGGLLNPGLVNTQTGQIVNSNGTEYAKTNGGLLNQLAAAASIAGTVMSDRRLKRDIVKVGAEPDGLGVYEYQYVWGGDRQRGVMADEVATLRPWALGPVVAGYASVDYSKLMEAA